MTQDINCKNCNALLSGNFCSNCGQKTDTHRITFGHFLHEFFHAFTHTDKGILLLMKALVIRPGYVAKEYLDGKRKKYFNPLTFLVILSSAYAYVSYKTGYFEALTGFNRPTSGGSEEFKETMQLMLENGKIINLFLMPVIISFLSWIFFRKQKSNLAENFVLNSFVLGQIYIIMIVIFIPGFLLFPETIRVNNNIFHGLMLAYMSLAYYQFFRNNIFVTVLKSILIIVLFVTLFWLSIWGYVAVKHLILG
jgi:hypothetical protein